MINLEIKLDVLKEDYPSFFEFFKDALNHSQSRFKNYKESNYKCYYYVGFYLKPSQKTEDYYEKLYKMLWDERIKEEYSKSRVTLTMVAGKFAISDQTKEISQTVKPVLDEIIARKMYLEQKYLGEDNNDILNSIPNFNELKDKIEKELEMQKDFLESLGLNITREKELNPQDRLKKLIDEEKYEEADELINKYPELKKGKDKE
jgi:hypothetical protein